MSETWGGALVPECHDSLGCIEAQTLETQNERSIRLWITTHSTFFLCLPPGLPSTLHGPNFTPGMQFLSKEEI